MLSGLSAAYGAAGDGKDAAEDVLAGQTSAAKAAIDREQNSLEDAIPGLEAAAKTFGVD